MSENIQLPERARLRWGVNLQRATYADAAARDEQLSRLAALGVTVGRIGLPWAWAEHTQGQYDWRHADSLVAAMEKHGIMPLVDLGNVPVWARPAGTPETFGPNTDELRQGFATYCTALAKRFKDRIYAYEIWNEANGDFWYPKPNMGDYSKLFVASYHALKAGDPSAPIVTTGMAGNTAIADTLSWTRAFVRTEAMELADGFGFHPYSNGDGKVSGVLLETAFVRQILDEAGFAHVPMYMTETGISTHSSRGVSEAMQAKVLRVTADWLSTIHGVNCVLWYCDMDSADIQARNPADPEGYFGLWRADGSAKPAVEEFASQINKVLPAGSVPANWWSYDGTSYIHLSSPPA
ncbi:MAG: cellulase family glycosylhydrolase [Luteococcus sp.]|uniref:cellulase family glycosylhydrolase n=1 Tax=Luteococcus sp. TaxID=1969402 RepID=UPI002647F66D|nr:cellulase family glycosylhydrolase [Luteococcus sp.]MDN5563784.1 cellulase family glycosylhydrolase [Luteococcus sp.]